MFGKSLVFVGLLLALLAFQGMEASRPPVLDDSTTSQFQQFLVLLKQLKNIQGGSLVKAQKSVRSHQDTAAVMTHEFLEEGVAPVDKAAIYPRNYINQQLQQAAETGKDISSCTDGKLELIESLHSKLTAHVTSCINEPANVVKDTLHEYGHYLATSSNTITGLYNRFQQCLLVDEKIKCMENMLTVTRDLLNSLNAQIPQIFFMVNYLVDGLPAKLEPCANEVTNMANGQFANLVVNVSLCIKNLKSHSRS